MDISEGLIIFALTRLAISMVNWIYYLATKYRGKNIMPEEAALKHSVASVSVLIPARNEQKNIGRLLNEILNFENLPKEIIVYDDLSTDNTAAIVEAITQRHEKVKIIRGKTLPDGWLGKNHACYQLAGAAEGDKLLFLDADVHIKNGLFEKGVQYMEKHRLKLLSIFPVQDMPTLGSRLSIPIMNWILLSLLPLPLVLFSRIPAFSAANGQFMLFDAKTYREFQPHLQCRNNPVEDITIIRQYKRNRFRVATLSGPDEIHCTMYHNLQEAVEGFSKNVFQFFGGSVILTYLFALITTLAPFYVFFAKGTAWGFFYLLIIILIRLFVSLTSHQSVGHNILLMIPQQFIFWKIILSATLKGKRKNIIWKDRNISLV